MSISLAKVTDTISINVHPPASAGIAPITRDTAISPVTKINVDDFFSKE
ncbi:MULTISPECIES: hypothetical protein [Vibrio harveyi group]|nr:MULTISPECIES: hypothetical protein [Vibrio harveyi group]